MVILRWLEKYFTERHRVVRKYTNHKSSPKITETIQNSKPERYLIILFQLQSYLTEQIIRKTIVD